jgi:hypothetical protein
MFVIAASPVIQFVSGFCHYNKFFLCCYENYFVSFSVWVINNSGGNQTHQEEIQNVEGMHRSTRSSESTNDGVSS